MIRYILDGIECNPQNRNEITYSFDFTDRRIRTLEMSVDTLVFVAEDYDRIKTWLETYSENVGMPLDVQYTNGTTIKYLLDFTDESTRYQDLAIKVKLKRFKGWDNFWDNANGLSFSQVQFNTSDYKDIDYIIMPEYHLSYYISLGLATYALSKELATAVEQISTSTAELIEAATPIPGLSPTGPTVSYNVGAIIVAGIKLLARIAYATFIIIALIKVMTEIINVLFPVVRQFKCMSIKTLIQRGCEKLGYTLNSTLLNSIEPLTIIPVPLKQKDPQFWQELFIPNSLALTKGFPTSRDTVRTLGELISAVEEMYNCKTKVIDGVVTIEQEMYFAQQANQNIPVSFILQSKLQNEYKLNSSEQFKRLVVNFQVDSSDFNTYDDTKNSLFELSSDVVNSLGRDYELIKGYYNINIPFARATAKGELNLIEKTAKAVAIAVDFFTGGNLAAQINDRKNVMQISQQYYGTTKIAWMNGSRISTQQYDKLSAKYLAENYHYSRFITYNKKQVYENMKVALTESELFSILSNNFVILNDGKIAEITRLNWSDYTNSGELSFKVKVPSVNVSNTIVDA